MRVIKNHQWSTKKFVSYPKNRQPKSRFMLHFCGRVAAIKIEGSQYKRLYWERAAAAPAVWIITHQALNGLFYSFRSQFFIIQIFCVYILLCVIKRSSPHSTHTHPFSVILALHLILFFIQSQKFRQPKEIYRMVARYCKLMVFNANRNSYTHTQTAYFLSYQNIYCVCFVSRVNFNINSFWLWPFTRKHTLIVH